MCFDEALAVGRPGPDPRAFVVKNGVKILRRQGHTVVEATSAHSAREVMTHTPEPIDVVLLDLRLPDSNDLQLLEEVRHRMPQSAVVLMTAYGSPEVAEGALRLGAYRVVSRPFDMHEIDTLAREAYQALPCG